MPGSAIVRPVQTDHRRAAAAARIDDLLGPARDRYFGEGYRRIRHELRDVAIDCADDCADGRADDRAGVRALAWIDYPADWAVKHVGGELRPHLSSLDTLVIGTQLCEAYLVHRYRLGSAQRRRMWLRRIDARAGARPQEALAGFEVSAKLRGTRPLDGRRGVHVSTFDCVIGTMRLRCEIAHEVTARGPKPGRYRHINWLLGPANWRYYGAGYRGRGYEIRDVGVDPHNTYADCVVLPAAYPARSAVIGIESAYQPCVSMAESIMVTAQLSEVLLYRTDGLERARSNTMWLRSLTMERPDPGAGRRGADFSGSVAVSKSRVVDLNGARWRVLDMVAYCQGIEQTHSLAHQLPASAVSESAVSESVVPGEVR